MYMYHGIVGPPCIFVNIGAKQCCWLENVSIPRGSVEA